MIVPYTVLPNVCNFEVKLISSLLIDYDIQLATNSRIPDHSILTCTLNISEYERIRNERLNRCETSSKGMKYQSTRKYNVSAIPQGLFASERCTRCLEHVVDSILDVRNIGGRINTIYETLIDALHNEMDDNMDYIDFTPSSNKRKRRNAKPYWNNELRDLLIITNKAEKNYLHFKGDRRLKNNLKNTFKEKRRQFDKRLRQEERKYKAQRLNNIKTLNRTNPKEFWREVNKLGPGKANTNIDSVIMDDGSVSSNPNDILSRWKSEYSKLFSSEIQQADSGFIEQIQQLNEQLEHEYEALNPSTETIDTDLQLMNDPISLEETKRALQSLKNGKAVGIDNIPNEILKSNNLTSILHELYNVNIDKTKIMHIRKASAARCDSEFMLGNTRIDFANKYRYLGLMISEDMDYAVSVKELSTAASRALGSLTSKYLHMGNMDFATYTKIFENTVIPVMDYASGVWGSKRYDVLERLQYRAIRTFLGVGKTSPIPAITGDMGWTSILVNNQCNIVRLWCRLMKLPDFRISRKVFLWDIDLSTRYKNTWFNSVKTILNNSGLSALINCTNNHDTISTKYVIESVKTKLKQYISEVNVKHFSVDLSSHSIIYSDASDTGLGGFIVEIPHNLVHCIWVESERRDSSTWKEFSAVKKGKKVK
ncbi:unnamed protein product [Mytilus edulis]|uniref:Uncharacterized protein n=1 Tax=Mytilus edulis TaxID=6550 RepID=A0A8S3RYB3_MYTED|nr:unnamed protein product [Mytilus edulis]